MVHAGKLDFYRRALFLAVTLILWGLITHGTYAGTGDEPHYQMVAHSLAFDWDVDLRNDYEDPGNLIFGGNLPPEDHAREGVSGALRPVHDIGLPLLFTPYFAMAYRLAEAAPTYLPADLLARAKLNSSLILRHLMSMAMIAITAWIAVQLFDVIVVSTSAAAAAMWSALFVLSPPLLSHAFLFFPDILSAALVLWVFRTLFKAPGRPMAGVAGIVTGGLLLLHSRNIGLVAGLVLVAVRRARSESVATPAIVAFCLGLTSALIVRTYVNYLFWGSLITSPHAHFEWPAGVIAFSRDLAARVAGWAVDQEHGLLPYAPIYFFGPVGGAILWRRDSGKAIDMLVPIVGYLAFLAMPFLNPHGWRGGWSPAARYLVPIAPLLAILTFEAVFRWTATWSVRIVLAIQIAADAILWQYPKLLWNEGTGVGALFKFLDGGSGLLSGLIPSVPSTAPTVTLFMLAAVVVLWAIALPTLYSTSTQLQHSARD